MRPDAGGLNWGYDRGNSKKSHSAFILETEPKDFLGVMCGQKKRDGFWNFGLTNGEHGGSIYGNGES